MTKTVTETKWYEILTDAKQLNGGPAIPDKVDDVKKAREIARAIKLFNPNAKIEVRSVRLLTRRIKVPS